MVDIFSVRKVSAEVLTADIGSHFEVLVCRDVDGGELIDLYLFVLIAKALYSQPSFMFKVYKYCTVKWRLSLSSSKSKTRFGPTHKPHPDSIYY